MLPVLLSATFDESANGTIWWSLAHGKTGSNFVMEYSFRLFVLSYLHRLENPFNRCLSSFTSHRHNIVCGLTGCVKPIETVSGIWRTAEFREKAFELFGVIFCIIGFERLILTDDFEGFPLRKILRILST